MPATPDIGSVARPTALRTAGVRPLPIAAVPLAVTSRGALPSGVLGEEMASEAHDDRSAPTRTDRTSDAVLDVPVLSTTDRGSRMTTLAPGQPVGRLSAGLVLRMLAASALWAVAASVPFTALLALAPASQVAQTLGSPWATVAALIVGFFAVRESLNVRDRAKSTFGQTRVAGLLAGLTVTGGQALSAAWWLAASVQAQPMPPLDLANIATAPEIPREVGALVGAVWAVWAATQLARLPGALHHARSRQRTLERLQLSGTRHEGVFTRVDFRNHWVWDQPHFTVEVRFETPEGGDVVRAHMRTDSDRVPVGGTRAIVLTDPTGAVAVELDDRADILWEPENKYRAPEG
ncbi:hypothetical protein HF576_00260 [Microbacterium sp. CFH 90308]|uniref:Uncharacterized protein n=1 Tax=Microbacterium salsuginis TaxID=2722803 RepID=A0ABX1K5J8_9MICO|nr:hypothetical protein [Microbacterium sp. CFH 90308]NLP82273.1 hypothetical protein [Microbacterium sp. CFH 90308]